MPTYDYRCPSCGHRFELRQSFLDPPMAPCPHCRVQSQRVIHPVGVVFKGSGWYSTDNRHSPSHSLTDGKDGKEGKKEEPQDQGASPSPEKTESTAPAATSNES